MKRMIIPLLLFALPLAAAETGYRIVHPDGTVEFTDDPTRGGEPIQLREAPTIQSVSPPTGSSQSSVPAPADPATEAQQVSYESLEITSPQQDQTIWFDGSSIPVSVNISPRLGKQDEVVILLDGQEVARGRGSSFNLPQVYRGTHTLEAHIVSGGSVVIRSPAVNFHMRRHTIR